MKFVFQVKRQIVTSSFSTVNTHWPSPKWHFLVMECLRISLAVIKHDQNNSWQTTVVRNWKGSHQGVLLVGQFLMVYSAWFFLSLLMYYLKFLYNTFISYSFPFHNSSYILFTYLPTQLYIIILILSPFL